MTDGDATGYSGSRSPPPSATRFLPPHVRQTDRAPAGRHRKPARPRPPDRREHRRHVAPGAHGAARGGRRAAGRQDVHRGGARQGRRAGGRQEPDAGPDAGPHHQRRADRADGRGRAAAQPARAAAGRDPARRACRAPARRPPPRSWRNGSRRTSARKCCSRAPTCIDPPRSCSWSGSRRSWTSASIPSDPSKSAVVLAREALAEARRSLFDVLIVDTAGPPARRRRDDGRDPRDQRRGRADRDAVRRRQHGGPGRGECGARVRRRRSISPASC